MQVEFELTRDDYAAAVFSQAKRRMPKPWQWALLGVLLALVVGLAGALTLVTGDASWVDEMPLIRPLSYAIAAVLTLLVGLLLVMAALRRWVRSLPRDDGAVLGWHRVTLADDGLTDETRAGSAFVKWEGVIEVRDAGAALLVFVDRAVAHVVPKRAFASAAEGEQFLALARERAAAGRGAPSLTGTAAP